MRWIAVVFVVLLSCGIVMGQHYGPPAVTADGDTIWPVAIIHADSSDSEFLVGYQLACGDFNGDGFTDLAIAALMKIEYHPAVGNGRVYIFFGHPGFGGDIRIYECDVRIEGPSLGSQFGVSLDNAGDVNGDGIDDIIVNANVAGKTFIFYGRRSWDSLYLASDANIIINSPDCWGCGGVGDINGDGFDDFAIGQSCWDGIGRAVLFFGDPLLRGIYDANDADVKILGVRESGVWFGCMGVGQPENGIAGKGDINGDGISDFIINLAVADTAGEDNGAAVVFFGRSLWDSIYTVYDADFIIGGYRHYTDSIHSYSGVAFLGDVNGDGLTDFLATGNTGGSYGVTGYGGNFIFFGDDSFPPFQFGYDADVVIFGSSMGEGANRPTIKYPGDLNGDGFNDIVVPSYHWSHDQGRVVVFWGRSRFSGIRHTDDGDVLIEGPLDRGGNPLTGFANEGLSILNDIDGDGRDELAIGCIGWPLSSVKAGAVYIYEFFFPSTTTTCIPTLVFEDDFSDSTIDDKWYRVVYNAAGGSESDPPPYLDLSSDSAYAPSMVPNGDSWCANACYTRMEFDYTNGIIIEWDMNVTTSGSYWNYGKVGLSRGPVVTSRPRADSAYIDDTRCDVEAIASIEYCAVSDTHHVGLITTLLRPDSSYEIFRLYDGYAHVGSWNHYKIYVRPDLHVEYYVNDTLLYVSTSTICTSYATVPLVAGGRNFPGPIWMDNFRVYICRSTSDTCLPEGLIAYYPFNGSIDDKSNNDHNGTAHDSALFVTDMCGRADSALIFDGHNYLDYGDFHPNTNYFSVSLWIQPRGITDSVGRGIIGDAGFHRGFRLYQIGKSIRMEFQVPGDYHQLMYEFTPLSITQWHHIVAVADSGNYYLYVDAIPVDSLIGSSLSQDGIFTLKIGTDAQLTWKYWFGKIDNVRIYDRPLSADEVQTIYECEYCKAGITEQKGIVKPTQLSISVIPNPFNASCKIIIDAPKPGEATIYDIVGTKVNSFKLIKGRNEFIWRAENNPSGLYLIRAVAGKVQQSERVILIK